MPTCTGTNADQTIMPGNVSPTVTPNNISPRNDIDIINSGGDNETRGLKLSPEDFDFLLD